MRTPPGSALSHQSVEDDQQLPHTRNQRHLLGLSGLNESLVEFLDGGIEARSDQGSHVERFSNPRPAAPRRATASQSARVAIERSEERRQREPRAPSEKESRARAVRQGASCKARDPPRGRSSRELRSL